MRPIEPGLAAQHEHAARCKGMGQRAAAINVGKLHQTCRAQTEGRDGFAKTRLAVNVRSDALAGQIFIDDDLIGLLVENSILP